MKKLFPVALAFASASVAADNAGHLEHVLVTVPVHKKAAETALPVTVLSGEALRRQAAATIGETLSNSPGLASASFGPGVGQPVIRGQAGPRVTVLQNGTSSADAANISADHAVSVEPMLADSVEVLRGPATLLYGGGAIGGVVNVVDSRIPSNFEPGVTGGAEARYDSASEGRTVVGRLDAAGERFAFHLDGLYRDWDDIEIPGDAARAHEDEDHDEGEHEEEEETTNGYVANSDGETSSLTAGGSFHFEKGFVGVAVNRLENEYGIPPGGHGHHDEHEDEEHHDEEEHEDEAHHDEQENDEDEHGEEAVRLDIEQTRYDTALHLHEPFRGVDTFRGFLTYTDYNHVELEGDEVGTEYNSETWETRLEMVHSPWGKFHGSFGLQASDNSFSAEGEESFIPETDSTTLGLFLVEDYHLDRLTLEGGLRGDWVERKPTERVASSTDFTSFSISGALLYELTNQWQFGAALMRAERAPAVEELYSNVASDNPEEWVVHAATGAIELGDQDLDTEISNNLDLSLSWLGGAHFATLNVFYNDFSDYIALLNTGLEVDEVPVYAYDNEDAEFYGLEFESEFTLSSLAGGDLLLGLQADTIRGKLDRGGDVPRLPPMRLGAELSWLNENWRLHAGVLDADDQDRPGANEEATEGYTRWDAGVEYRRPVAEAGEIVLFVKFKNITDEEIRLSTSFLRDFAPEAGRSIEGGLRLML